MYCQCYDNSKFPDIFEVGRVYFFFWPVGKEWVNANVFPHKEGVKSIISMSGVEFFSSFHIVNVSSTDKEIDADIDEELEDIETGILDPKDVDLLTEIDVLYDPPKMNPKYVDVSIAPIIDGSGDAGGGGDS